MSKVVYVFLEERFLKDRSGKMYSKAYSDQFWNRYLDVYDDVCVVARASLGKLEEDFVGYKAISSSRVIFFEVEYYLGPKAFLRKIFLILPQIREYVNSGKIFILRMPGMISNVALLYILLNKKKYAIELVGNPYDVFSSGGVGGIFKPIYRIIFDSVTKIACRYASAISYVSKSTMISSYPASSTAYITEYSSIDLPKCEILNFREIKKYCEDGSFTLLCVGSLDQRYKGFDLMIKALGVLVSSGLNLKLRIVGDGAYRSELEELASETGLKNNVFFVGAIGKSEVLFEMDSADIFVMPSRTEGLPRALIEAMSRGLPAIGSRVGGIPDLLAEKFLFKSEDYIGLASLIKSCIFDYDQLKQMSADNISVAKKYEASVLQNRRKEMYSYLANISGYC